jgi:hypothetical protein
LVHLPALAKGEVTAGIDEEILFGQPQPTPRAYADFKVQQLIGLSAEIHYFTGTR